MARAVFVEKARKDNPAVKAGKPYWWWKFRYGGKHYSATPPRRSQLTQSYFLSTIWDVEDTLLSSMTASDVEDLKSTLTDLLDECEGNLENVPEALQESSILNERIQELQDWIDALESLDTDEPERNEGESDDDFEDRKDDAATELADAVVAVNPGSW